MSTPNISAVTSQLVCDLKDQYPTKAHNITSKGLLSDPLGENTRGSDSSISQATNADYTSL